MFDKCCLSKNLLKSRFLFVIGFLRKRESGNTTLLDRRDAQGNIVALIDSSGAVVVRYAYDAWGNHAVLDGNGNDITDANHIGNLNPFRYRGYFYDVETELYYLQTRYYDPEIGRFITIDSIEYLDPEFINGLNLYAYCGDNPVMRVDPDGTFFLTALLIGLIVGAAVGTVVGGTVAGVKAYNSGLRGWKLAGVIFGGAMLGCAVGAAAGALAGAMIGAGGALMGAGASMIGGSFAIAGGGTAALGTAVAGVGAVALGGTLVIGGVQVAIGGLNILLSRIGESNGYKVDHHYPNDHEPVHVHISGDDGKTKVDLNGNPIQGNRPMTFGERKAFWKLIDKIIKALKPFFPNGG